MSRTDVHNPHWVKLRDPAWSAHFTDEHRHAGRDCDLEAFLAEPHLTYWQGCYRNFVPLGVNVCCGCPMCTNRFGRWYARRAERVAIRAQLRAAVKTAAAGGRDGIDVPRPAVARKW